MTIARLYVEPPALVQGRLRLQGKEHHHLSRVLRMKRGQALQLLDGRGRMAMASIAGISSSSTTVTIGEVTAVPEERPRLHLFQALSRAAKMDRVVQWSVELGAAAVIPFACGRSRSRDSTMENRLERWRKIALESSRVAGRHYLPLVEKPLYWEDTLARLQGLEMTLFADEAGGERPSESLREAAPLELGLVIGPEGGFTDEERAHLAACGAGAVTLGKNILRTETAGMVLLTAVRCHYGML